MRPALRQPVRRQDHGFDSFHPLPMCRHRYVMNSEASSPPYSPRAVQIAACCAALSSVLLIAGCAEPASLPVSAGTGPNPTLPKPADSLIPTVNIAPAVGWPDQAAPRAAAGLVVQPFAEGLDHPRWLSVLPNGDVLVAESNAPPKPEDGNGIKGWITKLVMKRAGSGGPSANRITLLRDTDGDGRADLSTPFLQGLNSPFGMQLVGDTLYVANTDAVVAYPYTAGATRIDAAAREVVKLPAGPINHHWTKNLIASKDGKKLYVTTGSNSNIAENGMAAEEGRAAIWEVDIASGSHRIFASGLRNPNGMAWEPTTGALWTVVNERDELGSDLVPDYLTSVKDGAFYGWPYSYFGQHVDRTREAAGAGSGCESRGARLRTRAAHRVAGTRLVGRRQARPRVGRQRHVHRPARLLEPQAAQRLQGDLRAVRPGRKAQRPADRRADRLSERRRQGLWPAGWCRARRPGRAAGGR